MKQVFFLLFAGSLALPACEDQQLDRAERPPTVDAASSEAPPDGGEGDGGDASPTPDGSSAAPACTTAFGMSITPQFGRLDGTVRIVVTPGLPRCKSDNDHVSVQIDVIEGQLRPNAKPFYDLVAVIAGEWQNLAPLFALTPVSK